MRNLVKKLYHNRIVSFLFPTVVYCLKRELSGCESVLDLGCGPSSPLQYCRDVKKSLGVEIFDEYLKASKSKNIHSKYLKKDILDLDFPKDSFDAVIMIEVLEHLPEKVGRKILKKAEKWARKKLIVSSPNGFLPQKSLDDNPWQKHLSGWSYKKMSGLGFTCHGLAGFKFFRREVQSTTMGDDMTATIRFQPKSFWFVIASLSQILAYHLPRSAFGLFSIKKLS